MENGFIVVIHRLTFEQTLSDQITMERNRCIPFLETKLSTPHEFMGFVYVVHSCVVLCLFSLTFK